MFSFLPFAHGSRVLDPSVTYGPQNNGLLHCKNGFLCGWTYDGRRILIHSGGDIPLVPTAKLNTQLYIVSRGGDSLDTYDAIEFVGGCANSVFKQQSLALESLEPGSYKVNCENDVVRIPIGSAGIDELTIKSGYHARWLATNGNAVENTGVELRIVFDGEQKIEETVCRHCSDAEALIAFLTFRKEVWFEHVYLLRKTGAESEGPLYLKVAECYLRDETDERKPRENFRCISLNDISPVSIGKLYTLVVNRNAKRGRYSVDFIPKSDRSAGYVTAQRIRDACTAIEVETDARKLPAECTQELQSVVDKMKDIVADHKSTLTEREISYLQGSLSHITAPATELAVVLLESQKNAVEPILNYFGLRELSHNDVQSLIKARNSLTHAGGATSIDDRLAGVAVIFMAVVYSSILERCSIPHEKIREVLAAGLMTC